MTRFTRVLAVAKNQHIPMAWKRITPSTNVPPPPAGRPPFFQNMNPRSTALKLAIWMTVSTISFVYIPWNDIFGFSGNVRSIVEDTLTAPPPHVDKTYSESTIVPIVDAKESGQGVESAAVITESKEA